MPILHEDLAVLINNTTWWVIMKDDHELQVPYYYRKYPERRPLYSSMTTHARAAVTIHQIVEFCNDDIEFAIETRDDMLSIIGYLQSYYERLLSRIDGYPDNHPHAIYAKKCKVALNVLKTHGNPQQDIADKQSNFNRTPTLVEILKRM